MSHEHTVENGLHAAIREAHPVTESRRCGNRLAGPVNPPPGPSSPPIWCARDADGHDADGCVTWGGVRLAGYARGGLSIEVRPPVVTYRCETCRTEQDHRSPAPCATLAALTRVTPPAHEPPAWCLCGVVDDLGDGTCGNCGLRIMTGEDKLQTLPIPPGERAEHDWKPTTNTLAVWKCGKCGAVGFAPHPLPRHGCATPPSSSEVRPE